MANFSQLITPECIISQLSETEHEEVVLEMINHLCKIGKIPSGDCYYFGNAVLERESHVGTGIGSGVAIPHARVRDLKDTVAAFARSEEGVDFDSPDNAPSHFICLLLVPEDKAAQHLSTLADLGRLFSQSGIRKQLEKAASSEEIHKILASTSS